MPILSPGFLIHFNHFSLYLSSFFPLFLLHSFPGLQQSRSVHRYPGTPTGDDARLLADGVGAAGLLHRHAHQLRGKGQGEYVAVGQGRGRVAIGNKKRVTRITMSVRRRIAVVINTAHTSPEFDVPTICPLTPLVKFLHP